MPIIIGALKRLEIMRRDSSLRDKLWSITQKLQSGLKENGFNLGVTESCVTPVFLSGGVGEATNLTVDLRENYGIFCSIVTYPVVPKGAIMLRLIPTDINTEEDVKKTINAFKEVKEKLFSGKYVSDKIAEF